MAGAGPKPVKWTELLKKVTDIEAGTPKEIAVQKETIPIVFVPGIMGSRLKKDGKKLWDPDSKGFMLWNYGLATVDAADKKAAIVGDDFDPDRLVPFDDDDDHNQKFSGADEGLPPSWPRAAKRGWGTVAWGTYGEILQKLQAPETWPAPLRGFFDLPVYAFGYNWSASNVTSGEKLARFIEKIVGDHQKQDGWCEHVIVVTHSMGGLVTRWACEKDGARDRVLGVVHGVQPAVGSAAAYWRMKAGFERDSIYGFELPNPSAWVLGTNGREVTALLGWMPGGLELLPGPAYTDNSGSKDWLTLHDHEGKERGRLGANALDDIYTKDDPRAYWRLVHKEYLLPAPTKKVSADDAFGSFKSRVKRAKAFHEDVAGKAHPETQAFYGAGKRFASCDRIEFRAVVYDWKAAVKDALAIAKVVRMVLLPGVSAVVSLGFEAWTRTEWWQSRGQFKVSVEGEEGRIEVRMAHPGELAKGNDDPHGAGAGDGTVPESSGKALEQRGDAIGGERAAQGIEGVAHEPAYHADQRGMLAKAAGWLDRQLGAPAYAPPAENPVAFTVAALKRLLRLEIKRARGRG